MPYLMGQGVRPCTGEGCTRPIADDGDKMVPNPAGVFLKKEFRSRLCRCEACHKEMSNEFLDFMLESEDAEQDQDEEPAEELSSEFDTSAMLDRALERMPRDAAIDGLMKFKQFSSHIIAGLKDLTKDDPNRLVTKQDIEAIVEGLHESHAKRRRLG